MTLDKKVVPTMIQNCVDTFSAGISGSNLPEVPFAQLREAAALLSSLVDRGDLVWFAGPTRSIEAAVAGEFLARLQIRHRNTDSDRVGEALRHAQRAIEEAFPPQIH